MASKNSNFGMGGHCVEQKHASRQIAEMRIEVARRTNSEALDLQNLALTELPASIGRLVQLQTLLVAHCKLTVLPEELGNLRKLKRLYIQDNQLTQLPETLSRLTRLQKLHAQKNRLTSIPSSIGQLLEMQVLDLSGNQISALPDSIGQLIRLKLLSLSGNRLKFLPESIGGLQLLRVLDLSNNELAALPDSFRSFADLELLLLHANPELGLPPEMQGVGLRSDGVMNAVVSRWAEFLDSKNQYINDYDVEDSLVWPRYDTGKVLSTQHILETLLSRKSAKMVLEFYFSSRYGRPLNEAKMILVGRGGVGKTSLVNRLARGRYSPKETKTEGIAITTWPVQIDKDVVRLNIWDFGGQEIMHATHQFFLTKRSLYLLVLNAREGEQDANVEYWLQLIESFGGNSPVLVVINKAEEHSFDLNRRGLQAKFPAIRGFVQTDCETQLGIDELRRVILQETDKLDHLRDQFPVSWFTIKDKLANLPKNEGTNFIPFTRYQELCTAHGVTEMTSQETLVGFLHDLGIVVNFRDNPRLSETQVLDPEWVTNGIYKILNADWLEKRKGELRLEHLTGVLDQCDYPQAMHLYLLDLMRKFELCYEFYEGDGHYLVPELLGKEEPDLKEFETTDTLRFEYRYNILPEGLLPRFVVRSRALNKNLPRWRTGVVLAWDGNRAVVKADVQDRRVSVIITGPLAGRRRLLAVIRADMEHIHRSIARLQATEHVPVPGHPGLGVEYSTLCVLEGEGESLLKLVYNGKVVKFQIADLLGGVEEPSSKSCKTTRILPAREIIRVAFSYSHKDEELRDQLETHLKLLQRQGVISTWHDRKILGGENWGDVIDDNFKRADLILLLVSADFLASDYCFETEMKMVLEREAKREARVVPVVLRACDWTGAPFGKLQGFPKDVIPVTSWANRDEAWTDVASGIRKVAEQLRAGTT